MYRDSSRAVNSLAKVGCGFLFVWFLLYHFIVFYLSRLVMRGCLVLLRKQAGAWKFLSSEAVALGISAAVDVSILGRSPGFSRES